MIPAVWYFVHLMGYYVKTSREAKVSAISQLSATSFKPHVLWVGTLYNTGDSARDAKENTTSRPIEEKQTNLEGIVFSPPFGVSRCVPQAVRFPTVAILRHDSIGFSRIATPNTNRCARFFDRTVLRA